MANVYAVKSGNWSDVTVWNTGALPTAADDVYSNNFTVTVDVSPTVLSVRNSTATGIVQGGGFTLTNGITLSATSSGFVPGGTGTLITSPLTAGQSATLNGSLNNTFGTSIGVTHSGAGTLNFIGNLTGAASGGTAYYALRNTSSGTVNIIGNCVGSGNGNHAAYNASSGTINITGDCTGISSNNGGSGAANVSNGIINITGSCNGGSISNASNYGALNSSTGTINVTGAATGGHVQGINNVSSGTVTHFGTATASSFNSAIICSNSGILYTTGPFIGTQSGISALTAGRWRWVPSVGSSYMTAVNSTATGYKNLYTSDRTDSQSGQPAVTNVRSGTIYGPNSELTGTCAVPPAGSVALGVPVDNTTGTAVLTQANFQAALDAQGLTSARAAKLDNLDATVSSRLASASYTAPPTPEQNATAVRTELNPELNNLDVAVSTRSTFNPAADTVANVTLVATTTNLTNPPDVPTTSEIADAVRVELTPELNHLDADVSSRLASVDYTIPPTPEQNAQAVEVQLALPLSNLDVAVSTRSTFNPTSDIVAQVALVDVTTDLTNPPVVPTPEQIATAVRTELEPELDRIDVDVSSRLAATDYEQAPTSEQNAEAVRTELAPELDRVANCATVATTGQQIQNALSI